MLTTLKLCDLYDCTNGELPQCPHDAVKPCEVFKDVESDRWYYEATARRVILVTLQDGGFFDAETWLEQMYVAGLETWSQSKKVHRKSIPSGGISRPSVEPAVPTVTNKELDMMADKFIRGTRTRHELMARIHQLGKEIGGFRRFKKKYGVEISEYELNNIQDERAELQEEVDEIDDAFRIAGSHASNDREWEKRWSRKTGRTGDIIYLYSTDSHMYEINRNGLKVDGVFVHLPTNDSMYFECMTWAEENLGVKRPNWVQTRENDDQIGKPLRRNGKKNAKGGQIRAFAEQKSYAMQVQDVIRALRRMKVSVHQIRKSKDLHKLYDEVTREKLNQRR